MGNRNVADCFGSRGSRERKINSWDFLIEEYSFISELPQYLLESGWSDDEQSAAVVVPRRIAAMTLAIRVAEEKGVELGDEVNILIND